MVGHTSRVVATYNVTCTYDRTCLPEKAEVKKIIIMIVMNKYKDNGGKQVSKIKEDYFKKPPSLFQLIKPALVVSLNFFLVKQRNVFFATPNCRFSISNEAT